MRMFFLTICLVGISACNREESATRDEKSIQLTAEQKKAEDMKSAEKVADENIPLLINTISTSPERTNAKEAARREKPFPQIVIGPADIAAPEGDLLGLLKPSTSPSRFVVPVFIGKELGSITVRKSDEDWKLVACSEGGSMLNLAVEKRTDFAREKNLKSDLFLVTVRGLNLEFLAYQIASDVALIPPRNYPKYDLKQGVEYKASIVLPKLKDAAKEGL
jgi:hypothetical protein